jgi:ribosomal protein S18 acetylase RimI-like enzyme
MAANVDSAGVTVRALNHGDREWADGLLRERWGSTEVVSRGRLHDAAQLPGFVAVLDAEPVGLLTYRLEEEECEIVTVDSRREDRGVGSLLLDAVTALARREGCARVWLITTNDNLRALGFYQRRGFELAALHRDALERARSLKPSIPLVGDNGIPLRDELELEYRL